MPWRSLAYLIVSPVYLAVASVVFLAARLIASLIVAAPTDQMALAMLGTAAVLTAAVKVFTMLDE
jgi:hypothetical protein